MYKQAIIQYLRHRPLFFAFIRAQEAEYFHRYQKLCVEPILDFGSGDGFFSQLLPQKPSIGLDIPQSLIANAGDASKLNVIYAGQTFPLKDNIFSTAVSNCVMEHLPDIDLNLAELFRVIQPGGYLITSVMTSNWNHYLIGGKLFGDPYRHWLQSKQVHLNLFSYHQWVSHFSKQGFNLIDAKGYLNQTTVNYLELAHYLSAPQLLVHKFTNKWNLFPQLHQLLHLDQAIARVVSKDLDTPISKAAAIFFVLQKPKASNQKSTP